MLQRLFIQNYVIIEKQEVAFSDGLNIITGETGAGKSILLGALSLVLGQRADMSAVFDNEMKAIVEATFSGFPGHVNHLLQSYDLDPDDQVIMRREIRPGGKSRAFINDTPVRLDAMQNISALLIDLHQQFESLEIQESAMQYDIVDAFAGSRDVQLRYEEMFAQYVALGRSHERLLKERADALRERDFLQFQLDELDATGLRENIIEDMESSFALQENALQIKEALGEGAEALVFGEPSVVDILRKSVQALQPYAGKSEELQRLTGRMESAMVEIEDLGKALSDHIDQFEYDAQSMEETEQKLDALRRLLIKHNVRTTEALLNIRDEIEARLSDWEALDSQIEEVATKREALLQELQQVADEVSALRNKAAEPFAETINDMLQDLQMKNARLKVAITPADTLHTKGSDHLELLFAPNLGAAMQPIKKVASGGELSRLSLCIKSAVSQRMQLPSLVFDEIDTGVSGEVAKKMGRLLKDLSSGHQVIMITHSPQIASRAGHHLLVRKRDRNERSIAEVVALNEDDRILEIAKMLSGDPPTKAAVLNAKELINV